MRKALLAALALLGACATGPEGGYQCQERPDLPPIATSDGLGCASGDRRACERASRPPNPNPVERNCRTSRKL